ncbi:PREDICTED: B3 domain-containing protein REM16-like [Ipomoea nil]|uniref:B3 domain-containing protein REM16-like n=1 Tax=Ipomoea nil TaxID=35883 RepID=UPI00090197FD|nr:PREDICTED: B3 domain-containing protein REM16-like [Ipomoea nil]
MYWSCFKTICFVQILSESFNQLLAVPQKFVNKMREKLESSVALIGPSGAIWNVGLTALGEELYFDHGWKEFVEEHSLQKNDMLLFEYNGGSQFKVKIFDLQSQCEKESSYFIRKCGRGDGVYKIESNPALALALTSAPAPTPTSDDETSSESSVQFLGSTKWAPPLDKITQKQASPPPMRKTSEGSKDTTSRSQLKSNRRAVTEEEKGKAKQMASAAVSPTGFTVIMAPGNVYRRFEMAIPGDWAKTNLPEIKRNFDLRLSFKGKTWTVRCYQRLKFGRRTILAGKGYRSFVLENQIEEFDVCVFEMASRDTGEDISFNVSIFRVVEDAVPPSRVNPVSSSK